MYARFQVEENNKLMTKLVFGIDNDFKVITGENKEGVIDFINPSQEELILLRQTVNYTVNGVRGISNFQPMRAYTYDYTDSEETYVKVPDGVDIHIEYEMNTDTDNGLSTLILDNPSISEVIMLLSLGSDMYITATDTVLVDSLVRLGFVNTTDDVYELSMAKLDLTKEIAEYTAITNKATTYFDKTAKSVYYNKHYVCATDEIPTGILTEDVAGLVAEDPRCSLMACVTCEHTEACDIISSKMDVAREGIHELPLRSKAKDVVTDMYKKLAAFDGLIFLGLDELDTLYGGELDTTVKRYRQNSLTATVNVTENGVCYYNPNLFYVN